MHSLHFSAVPILSLPVFGILFVLLIQLLEIEEVCALPLILALWAMKMKRGLLYPPCMAAILDWSVYLNPTFLNTEVSLMSYL